MQTVKSLVQEKKFEEARAYLSKESNYFNQRLADKDKPFPPELIELGNYIFRQDFKTMVDSRMKELAAIKSVSVSSTWTQVNQTLTSASRMYNSLTTDQRLRNSEEPTVAAKALGAEIERINRIIVAERSEIFRQTFESVIQNGTHPARTVGSTSFTPRNYEQSALFQAQAVARLQRLETPDRLQSSARALTNYLSTSSKSTIDARYERLALEILGKRPKTVESIFETTPYQTPFTRKDIPSVAGLRVAFVAPETTGASERFRVSINGVGHETISRIPERDVSSVQWDKYDFVLFARVNSATHSRKIISEESVPSRIKAGTRTVPNPAFTSAMIEYQSAQTEYRLAEERLASFPATCYSNACALNKFAASLNSSNASTKFREVGQRFASTPQTLQEDVFQRYSYRKVAIESHRSTVIDGYVFDVAKGRAHAVSHPVQESKRFNVVYNVRDNDVDHHQIQRQSDSESAVIQWEKRDQSVQFSDVFNIRNFKTARGSNVDDISVAIKTAGISSASSSTSTDGTRAASPVSSGGAGSVIADDRFHGIVVVEGNDGFGTGFYVSPNLIITSHHVVGSRTLVPLSSFEGRRFNGTVVSIDRRLDLALVETATRGRPLRIHSGAVRLGETVEVIGHPKGYKFTITRGVVSGIRKVMSTTESSPIPVEYVQTDASISPGNSGGPVFLGGAIIGVVDWSRVDKRSQNLNFSVSFNEIRSFLNQSKRD
jgi:S1-C subfamily serine protease